MSRENVRGTTTIDISNKILSTDKIIINKYETNFYFETMAFNKDEFVDIVDNTFFKKLLSEFIPNASPATATNATAPPATATPAAIIGKLIHKYIKGDYSNTGVLPVNATYANKKIDIITGESSAGIKQFNTIKENSLTRDIEETPYIIERYILMDLYREIFEFSMINLWRQQTDTLFILPCFNTDDNGVTKLSTTLKRDIKTLYEIIFDKNDTNSFKLHNSDKTITFNKNIPSDEEILQKYKSDIEKRDKKTNQILFIHALPDNTNEPIDSYKNIISEDIENIDNTIKNRANDAARKRPFKQIIYFINPTANDTMFTDYFTTTIKKKIC